jgi:ubiquinone/menaquinone biosynthesis C-methylase UbiE
MPNIDDILKLFGKNDFWKEQGDEWSDPWGSSYMQWIGVIQPRIHAFVPTKTILEIAPGFGRWTQYLRNLCNSLIAVDIAENCIEYCRKRFAGQADIHFFVNDGKTLNMATDNSVDFIFSFDSLVHVEMDVLDSYIKEFSRILNQNGVAFIHHSNLGSYQREVEEQALDPNWRGTSVTYEKVFKSCEKNNLRCITQEIVNWGNSPEYLIDCFSLVCRKSAYPNHPYKLYQNGGFNIEQAALRRIYQNYSNDFNWGDQTPRNVKIDLNAICAMASCREKEQYKEIIQDKDKLINDLLRSRSWKLTAPLRAIFRLLRGLRW